MKNKQKRKAKENEKKEDASWNSIRKKQNCFLLVVLGKPNAKRTKITQVNEQYIGIAIAAPPKDGEANEELLLYLGKLLGIKKNGIYLDKGNKSRDKVVVIEEFAKSMKELVEILESEI